MYSKRTNHRASFVEPLIPIIVLGSDTEETPLNIANCLEILHLVLFTDFLLLA
jgi:hypothetical protein